MKLLEVKEMDEGEEEGKRLRQKRRESSKILAIKALIVEQTVV